MFWAVIILSIVCAFLIFSSVNFFRRSEYLEDKLSKQQNIFQEVAERIKFADRKLKEIDDSGHFAADDEIGFFFKEVKKIQDILYEFSIRFYEDQAGEPMIKR